MEEKVAELSVHLKSKLNTDDVEIIMAYAYMYLIAFGTKSPEKCRHYKGVFVSSTPHDFIKYAHDYVMGMVIDNHVLDSQFFNKYYGIFKYGIDHFLDDPDRKNFNVTMMTTYT
jgi:hypothetical protein